MKITDLVNIIDKYPNINLNTYPNNKIVSTLKDMMI